MNYEKVNLFGFPKSRGTFDDFYDTTKYGALHDAYDAGDYVEADFVKDADGVLYIEAKNVSSPEKKLYHKLNYQHPVAGIDVSDDTAGCNISLELI